MKTLSLSSILYLLSATLLFAGLSATVQPGYTFGADEVPTIDNLNLLGLPTISVYGTVDGSNGVAPNSLTGDQLVNGFPDDVTLEWYSSGPRSLRVKGAGIGTNQLAASAFAAPLTGGNSNVVTIATNSITRDYLKTNWVDGTAVSTNATTNAFILLVTSTTAAAVTNTVTTAMSLTNLYTALGVPSATAVPAAGAMAKFRSTATGPYVPGDTNLLRSLNVSNIVRASAGDYTLTFTNSFATTNYVVNVTCVGNNSGVDEQTTVYSLTQLTNSVSFTIMDLQTVGVDPKFVHVTIFP